MRNVFALGLLVGLGIHNPAAAETVQTSSDLSATLINGTPADPGLFPASVVASSGGGRCTATVVGSQALFIASHCVNHNGTVTFSAGGNSYSAVCAQTPEYRRGVDLDIALCKVNAPVTGVPFEVLNMDANLIKVGDRVQLTGYGCTRPGGTGGNDGIYRIADASITRLPNASSFDYITNNGGALCFGDSGGPAFYYLDAERTRRLVISANSKGNISTTSYLASSTTAQAKAFIDAWVQANNVEICGVTANAQGCRLTAAEPPVLPSEQCQIAEDARALDYWSRCLREDVRLEDAGDGKPSVAACDRVNSMLMACFASKVEEVLP